MTEREIFNQAVQIADPDERAAFIRNACGNDTALAQHVGQLLAAYEQAGSFLESPAGIAKDAAETQVVPPQFPSAPDAQRAVGETVAGKYKLLQVIGEGGMGVVYMAEQRTPIVRRVAIKITKPGLQSAEVLARFEAERQALAVMDHPNIARVFDAGTTDAGLPYFVMELVHGIPITRYCDEAQLNLAERLALFVPVCQAVQHAHQKGIIHRDIKPPNVLVAQYDGKPVPKVIDFGVAKAIGHNLTERTLFTQFGAVVGTLEYMSPEQATLNALDVDTRSDIYSLGVLLYELLTGETPMDRKRFQRAAFDEVLRLIRNEEPPKPSTRLSSSARLPAIAAERRIEPRRLASLVRGELDWIVMKALEKERDRRYSTAKDLAEDVERHLTNQPIAAGPPSSWYRLRKFVNRNRVRLKAAALMVAILTVAAAIVFWASYRAKQSVILAAKEQKNAAEAKRKTAETRKQAQSQQLLVADLGMMFDASKAPADVASSANTLSNIYSNPIFGEAGKVCASASKLTMEGIELAGRKKPTEALSAFDRAIAMLKNIPKAPNGQQQYVEKLTSPLLSMTLCGRGRVLDSLHRDAEADRDWDEAISLGPPRMRAMTQADRLASLTSSGNLMKAVAKADEWSRDPAQPPEVLVAAAKVYSAAAEADATGEQTEKYRQRAIALLEQAEKRGFFGPSWARQNLAKSKEWKSLRGDAEFAKLVARVSSAAPEKPADAGALIGFFNMMFAAGNTDDPAESAEIFERAMSRLESAIPEGDKFMRTYLGALRNVMTGSKLEQKGQHEEAAKLFDAADASLAELSKLPPSTDLPPDAIDQLHTMLDAARAGKKQSGQK